MKLIALIIALNSFHRVKPQTGASFCFENTFFGTVSNGNNCILWSSNGLKTYPDDFQGVVNQVDIYQCPTSGKRIIISNGIPDHDVVKGNPNSPCEKQWSVALPLNPERVSSPSELPVRGIIAMSTNGVPAYGPQEGGSTNAVEPSEGTSIVDAQYWYGHPDRNGNWHTHNPYMGKEDPSESDLLGYALDGSPIHGPLSDPSLLDDCNGRVDSNGNYVYHVRTIDQVDGAAEYCLNEGSSPVTVWNYILGCYSGSIDDTTVEDSSAFDLPSDCVKEDDMPPTPSPSFAPTSFCADNEDEVTLTIQTDGKASEIFWFLKQYRATTDKFFNIAKSGRGLLEDNKLYTQNYCVKKNKCFKFIIKDTTSKDGLCCSHGEGFWKVDQNGERLKIKKMIDTKKQTFQWGAC